MAAPHHLSGPPPPAKAALEIGVTVALPIVNAATASAIASVVFMVRSPFWYNQALRSVYFFGRQFDESVKYAKLITDPFATDYGYLAAGSAMAGDMAGAKVASAEVVRLDPNWSVEKYLSESGGFPDDAAVLFVKSARKAGVTACVPADKLLSLPNLVRIKVCDEERAGQPAG